MTKKIIHPIMIEIERDRRRAKFAEDLVKMHVGLLAVMEDFKKNIVNAKGPKGDKPSQAELVAAIKEVFPRTLQQETIDLVKSLIPDVKDGVTPSEDYLVSLIKKNLPAPKKEKNLPSTEEIVSMVLPHLPKIDEEAIALMVESRIDFDKIVEALLNNPKGKKLKIEHIAGLAESIRGISHAAANHKPYIHGGGDTVRAGTNITLTRNADGTTTITAQGGSAGSVITSEVLAGVQAGSNVTLTFSGLAHVATSIVQITRNGKVMTPGSTAVDGYTLTGVVSAIAYSADQGDTFVVTYGY